MDKFIVTIVWTLLVWTIQNVATHPKSNQLLQISIPDKRPLKRALGFEEDSYFNFTELTTKYGYPTEEYQVTTEDGYVLKIFRILPKCNGTVRGYPVVLLHGIIDTADQWILTGPDSGPGYMLSRKCYDVWAANHRGNFYSREHIRLNPNTDAEFWDFTFDEHGNYDLPAVVDYVLDVTKQDKVNYIGHSQGTTNFLVMTSLRPEYIDKVQLSVLISPIAWMRNVRNVMLKLITPAGKSIRMLLEEIGIRELLGKHQIIHHVLDFVCQYSPEDICGTIMSLGTGYKKGNISPKTLQIVFGHILAGISAKNLEHFGQLVATGKFQRFDEGMLGNLKRYGNALPPEYDVSRVTTAVVLVESQNDWLSDERDVDILQSKLPNVFDRYTVPDPTYSHNDIIFGIESPKYVFSKILEYLDMIST